MVFAYNFAKKINIIVKGFDSKIDSLKIDKEKDELRVIKELKKIMKNYSWKDMNKKENLKKLNTKLSREIIDREKEMLENIKKNLSNNGKTLIFTGCFHLDFIQRNFPEAIFPLR